MFRWSLVFSIIAVSIAALWYQGLLAGFYAQYPVLEPISTFRKQAAPLIIAHRGDEMRAPENTLAAYESAIQRNVDFIEVDMRLTSDGVPVVMHDATVDRTTDGEGPVAAMSYAEIRQLDAGSWFGPEYADSRVPKVSEVLELANGRTCILADIKPVPNYALVKMLRDFVAANGRDCMLISIMSRNTEVSESVPPEFRAQLQGRFDSRNKQHKDQMRVFNRYWPEFPLVIGYKPGLSIARNIAGYPAAVAVSVSMTLASAQLVADLHAAGYLVFTIIPMREDPLRSMDNSKEYYTKLDAAGVDALFVGDLDEVLPFFGLEPAR